MAHEIPVAAALMTLAAGEDLLVVEADPAGDATRCSKNLARYVFRHVQDLQWGGHEGPVTVEIAGDRSASPPIAPNLACLLAPLLETAIVVPEADRSIHEVFDVESGLPEISPRDRVWLVGEGTDRSRYDLVLRETRSPASSRADLLLALIATDADDVIRQAIDSSASDVAVVFVDAASPDHEASITVTG